MGSKSKIQGYISNSSEAFFNSFPPCETNGGTVAFIMDWAANVLRGGAIQAVNLLDIEERRAVVASVNNLRLSPRISGLGPQMADWFSMDEGVRWDWPQEKISELVKKLSVLSPSQTMGLVLWAKAFFIGEKKDIDVYVADFSRLFEK
jgi:hypothetical protein